MTALCQMLSMLTGQSFPNGNAVVVFWGLLALQGIHYWWQLSLFLWLARTQAFDDLPHRCICTAQVCRGMGGCIRDRVQERGMLGCSAICIGAWTRS